MDLKCPMKNNENCCETGCAWYVESVEPTVGQKELALCAVKLLALVLNSHTGFKRKEGI